MIKLVLKVKGMPSSKNPTVAYSDENLSRISLPGKHCAATAIHTSEGI